MWRPCVCRVREWILGTLLDRAVPQGTTLAEINPTQPALFRLLGILSPETLPRILRQRGSEAVCRFTGIV